MSLKKTRASLITAGPLSALTMLATLTMVLSTQASAADWISPSFSCYQSVTDFTEGPFSEDFNEVQGSPLLLPGTNSSTQGFYIYRSDSAYFFAFPSPVSANGTASFPLEIALPGATPFYLGYYLNPGEDPQIVFSPAPLAALAGRYSTPTAVSAMSDEGESNLHSYLQAAIQTATTHYQRILGECQGNSTSCPPSKADFVNALKKCESVSGLSDIISQQIAAIQKLPSCGCVSAQ